MSTGEQLLSALLASPTDTATRDVYADWLEERGDRRASFVRAQTAMREVEPDHPLRLGLEDQLSVARRGLDPSWLALVEPERAHLLAPGEQPSCGCRVEKSPGLHQEPQDTRCDAWKKLLAAVEQAAADQVEHFEPLRALSPDEARQIVTLPPSIATLKTVRIFNLAGSDLVRVPAELGEMTALENFNTYMSYRLHWLPYELTRSGYQTSMFSTRALYGNFKVRLPFPALGPPRRLGVERCCSLCRASFVDAGLYRVWVSLKVGTDVLPLLVNACGDACLSRLPSAPDGYVRGHHRGGPELAQPARGMPSIKRP